MLILAHRPSLIKRFRLCESMTIDHRHGCGSLSCPLRRYRFARWKSFEKNETLKKLVTSIYHYPATLWEPMCHLSNGYASCASRSDGGNQVHSTSTSTSAESSWLY